MNQDHEKFGDGKRPAFWRVDVLAWVVINVSLLALLVMAAASPGSAAEKPVRILMLGDSLTSGLGLIKGESLPDRLEAALQTAVPGVAGAPPAIKKRGHPVAPGARVLNAGVSGDTTAGGRSRLAWSLAARPDALIVALGANDGLRGLAPKQTFANLDAIIGKAKKAGIPVLLAGMRAPPNLGKEYGAAFDAVFPRLAARHGIGLFPFLLAGVAAKPDLNQDDGIHPNPEGIAVIVENILPSVLKLIERAGH